MAKTLGMMAKTLGTSRRSPSVRFMASVQKKPAEFDGEISELYTRISENHRHPNGPWPLMLAKVQSLNLPSGAKVLDLASGPGEPAITLAKALPEFSVTSTDISEDMVATALNKGTDLSNFLAVVADSQDLSAFESKSVDVCTCCYGFMFPQDKAKAMSEAHRVLKPGGTLVATYWTTLEMITVCHEVMTAVLGTEPPVAPINPLSLSQHGLFDSIAFEAGFQGPVDSTTSKYPFDFGLDPEFQYKAGILPVSSVIDELNAHDVARAAFKVSMGKYATTDPATGNLVMTENEFVMATLKK